MITCLMLSAQALCACTTASATFPDGTQVSFTRWWTDAAIKLGPDSLEYSSDASAVAQQALTDALLRALGLAVPSPTMLHASESGL